MLFVLQMASTKLSGAEKPGPKSPGPQDLLLASLSGPLCFLKKKVSRAVGGGGGVAS